MRLGARYAPNVALLLEETLAELVQRGRAVATEGLEDGFVVAERQRCLDCDLPLDRVGDLVGRRPIPRLEGCPRECVPRGLQA